MHVYVCVYCTYLNNLIIWVNSTNIIESAGEEKLSDFLREIELMKDIGKHKNVIQMYGCCTRYRPICLVLEYARGGNLLNYLRSFKKKVIITITEQYNSSNDNPFRNKCMGKNGVLAGFILQSV
jgi:serine/threonine protein kinase